MNEESAKERTAQFHELLLRYSQELSEERRSEIEQQLWKDYGATICTMVVDMSGFTRLADEHGIVHYLSMVRRMQLTAEPIVESYGGTIVKFEADNAFARFDLPGNAILAGIALNLAMDSANLLTPEELDVHVSCGIDYGNCLLPHSSDFFGLAVNRASKLGEDIGERGKILVTEEAMALVPDSLGIQTKPVDVIIGGSKVTVRSVVYRGK